MRSSGDEADGKRDFLDLLAEDYLSRRRRGEEPRVTEYTSRHPELEDKIRCLIAALDHLEPDVTPVVGPGTPGQVIGDYRILREIGRGGMGVVYEAEQKDLARHVALKILPGHDPRFLERFRREAQTAGRLQHPGIVPVYGVGEDAGVHYFAMQYVDGEGLDEFLRRVAARSESESSPSRPEIALAVLREMVPEVERGDGSSPSGEVPESPSSSGPVLVGFGDGNGDYPRRVAALGLQVAEALAHAHAHGVLHRDIKPSNILLDRQGRAWISDFGLCKTEESGDVTMPGDVVGTVRYMAPERFAGESDVRSDVYSLGLTLYEMATLRPAFGVAQHAELVRDIADGHLPRPSTLDPRIPRDLETIIVQAVCPRIADRYQTAAALASDLRAFLAGRPIAARPPTLPYLMGLAILRNRVLASTLAVAAMLIIVLTSVYVVNLNRSLARSRALGLAAASSEAVRTDPLLGLLLAREAVQIERLPETVSTLHRALSALRERAELSGHGGGVSFATYDAAGDHTLTVSDDGARVWDADGQKLLHLATSAICDDGGFLPRGSGNDVRVWTAEQDGWLRLWSLEGQELRSYRAYESSISDVAVSPRGEALVMAYFAGEAILLDGQGENPRILDGHEAGVFGVAFSPRGDRLVTVSRRGVARLWNRSGRLLRRFFCPDRRCIEYSARFAPDGQGIVTLSVPHAHLWDSDGGAVALLDGHEDWVTAAAFSPDGKILCTASEDQTLRVWDRAGRELAVLRGHGGGVSDVQFSPSGRVIASASHDQTVRLWEPRGNLIGVLHGHEAGVTSVRFAPDGRRLLTASGDRTARLWDRFLDEMPVIMGHRQGVYSAAFSPGGRFVLTASKDGSAALWDLRGRRRASYGDHGTWVFSAEFFAGGQRIVTTSRDLLARIWSLDGQRLETLELRPEGRYMGIVSTPRGDLILTRHHERGVRIWQGTELLGEFMGHEGRIWSATLSPDGEELLTAASDGTARLWSMDGRTRTVFRGHHGAVRCAVFSPDAERVLTGSEDGTARLWHRDGRQLKVLAGHEGQILGVDFSPSGQRIATASRDKTARLWDGEGHLIAVLTGHEGVVWSARFDPSGDRLVTGSFDGTARVWLVDTEDLLSLAERRAFRGFTEEETHRYRAFRIGD